MNSVDDIIINKQVQPKKKGKGILLIIIFLLIMLLGLCAAYWYVSQTATPKEEFFKYITQTNITKILDTDLYYSILEKINSEDLNSTTTANITTNRETEYTKNLDVSKFNFNLDIMRNRSKKASYINLNIDYSSNDFFDLSYINDGKSTAIGSTEIMEKYLATSNSEMSNSINRLTGVETDLSEEKLDNEIDEISDNRMNLEEEYKVGKISEYTKLISDQIPEESVVLTEDTGITINSNIINTNSYTLTLDAGTYSSLQKQVLGKLQTDEDFLQRLVTGVATSNDEAEEGESDKPSSLTIQSIDGSEEINPEEVTNPDEVSNPEEVTNPEEVVNPEEVNPEEVQGQTNLHQTSQEFSSMDIMDSPDVGPLLKSEDIEKEENIIFDIFKAIILNQKLNMTMQELSSKIAEAKDSIDSSSGIKITVYVKDIDGENNETLKVVIQKDSSENIDIEYLDKNRVKMTYLADEKNEEDKTVNKGFTLELERVNSDMQTKFDVIFSNVEEKKVVGKITVQLTTQGNKTSKNYENELIIKNNDEEGDIKINIKNTIDFEHTDDIQELTDENSVFLDKMSDEEVTNLFSGLLIKVMGLVAEKTSNMDFIDTNSANGIIQQPTENSKPAMAGESEANPSNIPDDATTQNDNGTHTTITKVGARDMLVKEIEIQMNEAQSSGKTYTIQNLNELPEEMDGYKVSVSVSEEEAIVIVAGYTFKIDKNFLLTEE